MMHVLLHMGIFALGLGVSYLICLRSLKRAWKLSRVNEALRRSTQLHLEAISSENQILRPKHKQYAIWPAVEWTVHKGHQEGQLMKRIRTAVVRTYTDGNKYLQIFQNVKLDDKDKEAFPYWWMFREISVSIQEHLASPFQLMPGDKPLSPEQVSKFERTEYFITT